MQRDGRLDSLRGLSLVVMTAVHLPYSTHGWFSGWLGLATFAHVFVFLSGFVAGMVYEHRTPQMTSADVWRKALQRAAWIWVAHVAVTIFVAGYVLFLHGIGASFTPTGTEFMRVRPVLGLALAAAMIYLPGYTHILAMYVFFVAVLAPTVIGLRRGRMWIVLAVSAALWAAAQLGVRDAFDAVLREHVHTRLGHYDVLGWQFLFVGGVVLGALRRRGNLDRFRVSLPLAIPLVAIHAVLTAIRHDWRPDSELSVVVLRFASNAEFGPLRLLDFAIVAVLGAEVMRRRPRATSVGFLALLGRHSMAVFIYHLVLVYTITPITVPAGIHVPATAAALASLALPAYWSERRRS